MPELIDQLKSEMNARFCANPADVRFVRSPYRICPLGAHIDHQNGPVTAMAIDQAVYLSYVPSTDASIHLQSLTFDGEVHFTLNDVPDKKEGDWGNFPRGAVRALQQQNHHLKNGIMGITAGRMNEGGLSSSAAIGVAYLLAFENANNITVSPTDNIRLDQAIENGYLGLKNGILDQSAILLSRKGSLTLIDCASVTHELIPQSDAMPEYDILIAQSGLRDALVSTGYNTRVDECAAAAQTLLEAVGSTDQSPILGHITHEEYEIHKSKLSGPPAKRAKHFFTESARVHQGIDAWRKGDLTNFGKLIAESGRSSIENYECGSEPLIDLYHILIETDGVYGARFSGAGFRGCCVALIDPAKSNTAIEHIQSAYATKHPDLAKNAPVFTCQPDNGACIL
ncbi:MAG: galactokinase family protein [Candidatus Latescibacteria bacterium]|jgi:galacturonokinase|nr:galactokinase family protein [Candidatus Latescibacterota bacterium]